MRISELGGGYSLECGAFWATEDKIYWASGQVSENKDDGNYHRITCSGLPENEGADVVDYSKWTDEQRAAVLARLQQEWEEHEAYYRRLSDVRNALCASARAKLTPDEIIACDLETD